MSAYLFASVEITDAVVPARALPESKLTAQVTVQNWGLSGGKGRLFIRDGAKVLASQEITFKDSGQLQTETIAFNCGPAGPKTLDISVDPVGGEENTANNTLTRVVNVGSEPRRILYIEGEPRWEYKFIRRAEENDPTVQLVSMLRTSENKIYRQGIDNPNELADGFPVRAEDLFGYSGIIIGSVAADYFTPLQQELLREYVDRRGGGILFLGGSSSLSDGGWGAQPKTPAEVFDIPFTSVSSFVLVMSSLTMVLALAAIQRGDHHRTRTWLLATAFLGMVFISGQVFEFTEFYREGLHLSTNMFGTTFYVLTGLHGAHVTVVGNLVNSITFGGRSFANAIRQTKRR